jgi:hypothetical protein
MPKRRILAYTCDLLGDACEMGTDPDCVHIEKQETLALTEEEERKKISLHPSQIRANQTPGPPPRGGGVADNAAIIDTQNIKQAPSNPYSDSLESPAAGLGNGHNYFYLPIIRHPRMSTVSTVYTVSLKSSGYPTYLALHPRIFHQGYTVWMANSMVHCFYRSQVI